MIFKVIYDPARTCVMKLSFYFFSVETRLASFLAMYQAPSYLNTCPSLLAKALTPCLGWLPINLSSQFKYTFP